MSLIVVTLLGLAARLDAQQPARPAPPLEPVPVVQIEGGVPPAPGGQTPGAPAPLPPLPVTDVDLSLIVPELDQRRVSLVFTRPEPVRNFLLTLAAQSGLSVVPAVSIDQVWVGDLRNVTVREALDLLVEPLGLDYTVRGGIISVFPRELETRLYNIDYVITQRRGTRSISSGGAARASAGHAAVESTDAPSFFDEVADGVRGLLSPDGTFNLDRTAALVRVTDRQSRHARIQQYLDTVMLRVSRQIEIQAHVIEVETSDAVMPSLDLLRNGRTFDGDIASVLDALKTQGPARVLARPRVTALTNQPALIVVGEDAVGGISLGVTPQIAADGIVTMSIHASASEAAAETRNVSVTAAPATPGAAWRADTVARVRDGQTVVVSGLWQRLPGGPAPGLRRTELIIMLTPTILSVGPAGRSAFDPSGRPPGGAAGTDAQ